MIDPSFIIPDLIKQRFVDWLVESVAGQAEQFGSDQAARVIRKLSSDAVFCASADQALKAGIERFIVEYRAEDEDLVDAIVQDATFWQSAQVQQALKDIVERPGASMPDQARVIARHFDTVLPQRVNRKRVDAAVSYLLGCVAQELWSLPGAKEVREIYSLQFQKMTAEESREQTALMRQQLEATLEFNAEMRQAFLQLTGGMEKALLAAPTVPALVASPRPYNNLPQPTYVRFVGRDTEIGWLRDRLSPTDRAWQIAINGIGGVGKTALALAIADEYRRRYHELPPEERFEAIVWVSAKEDVLTAHGRERADLPEAILHTLEDVYTAIARVLEREDITRALPEEQDALVRKALQRQRTLLVMDNMESVEDDRIKTFLRKLPAPTKAIITSRDWIDVADVRILRGLSPEDAEGLIREETTAREVALNAKQRERLYDLTAGLPLPLKLGIARMSAGESFAAVERWLGDATGDLPEYCVRGQVDLVRKRDPNAWTVLLVCSLFDRETGASREALGEIADLSRADRDQALAHLQRLFLVNQTEEDRYWVLPIVQRYASVELLDGGMANKTQVNWLGWLTEFAQQFGPKVELDLEVSRRFALEYPHLRAAILWCTEQQLWQPLKAMAGTTWPYPYYRSGLFNDLDVILNGWLTAATELEDELEIGRANLQLARLRWIWGQADDALRYLDEAERLLTAFNDKVNLAEAWDTRSQIYSVRGLQDEAERLAIQELQIGEEINSLDIQVVAALSLATIAGRRLDHREAHGWLDQAEEWSRQLNFPRRLAAVQYRRGTILFQEGNFELAEMLFLEVAKTATEMGERRLIADNQRRLAQVYAATGRYSVARETAYGAQDMFERLGMQFRLTEIQDLLWSLPQDPM